MNKQHPAETVLVVDDNRTSRSKITFAVEALGYPTTAVGSGAEALQHLAEHPVDLLLLDIVMPEMDGFELLKRVKADPATADIPVLVISALDDTTETVVQAIKLGAEDFLPKQSPRALLHARIKSSIEKKRQRNYEKQYIDDLEQLTKAASVLETGRYNPDFLGMASPLARDDSLGSFAQMFSSMAGQIYHRERRLAQQVRTLKAIMLLIAAGAVQGLGVPLSRMLSQLDNKPIGLTIWVLLFTAILGIGISAFNKRLPALSRHTIGFFLFWGVITAAAQALMFWVAAYLQASLLSMILVTEGFIVFMVAAAMKIETPTAKRLLGLFAGFIGVGLIVLASDQLGSINAWIWVFLALSIPAIYSVEDLLISVKMPEDWDITGAVGVVSLVSVGLLLPVAFWMSDLVVLSLSPGKLEFLLLLLAVETLVGTALMLQLLRNAGAVFGSQVGYVATFAGIAWSMMLLNESLSLTAWIALGIMLIGLLLVEPTHEVEEQPDMIKANSAQSQQSNRGT